MMENIKPFQYWSTSTCPANYLCIDKPLFGVNSNSLFWTLNRAFMTYWLHSYLTNYIQKIKINWIEEFYMYSQISENLTLIRKEDFNNSTKGKKNPNFI